MPDYNKLKICVANTVLAHSNGQPVETAGLDTRISQQQTQNFATSDDKFGGTASRTEGIVPLLSVDFVSYRDGGKLAMAGASFTHLPIIGDRVSETPFVGTGDPKEVSQMVKETVTCMQSKDQPKLTKPIANFKP